MFHSNSRATSSLGKLILLPFLLLGPMLTTLRATSREGLYQQAQHQLLYNKDDLFEACRGRARTCVEEIIGKHPKLINARNKNSDTPLHLACRHNTVEIISFLLRSTADPNLLNIRGETPLHHACRYREEPQIVTLLLQHTADPTLLNQESQSPLYLACLHKKYTLAQALLKDARIKATLSGPQGNAAKSCLQEALRQGVNQSDRPTIIALLKGIGFPFDQTIHLAAPALQTQEHPHTIPLENNSSASSYQSSPPPSLRGDDSQPSQKSDEPGPARRQLSGQRVADQPHRPYVMIVALLIGVAATAAVYSKIISQPVEPEEDLSTPHAAPQSS